jgi:site-specific DNA-methyltransferase (adenine-specific)
MTPFYEDASATIYHGDALEVMAGMDDDSVDAVITDPPYNVGKDYGPDHDDRMAPADYRVWTIRWLRAAAAVSRDGVVFTPGTANVRQALDVLDTAGLRYVRMLGWHRKEFAGDLWSGGPAISWEPVIWASKVEKAYFTKTFGTYGRDFLVVNSTHGNPWAKVHPCPKPIEVMRWLVGLFVPPDGSVLDPFVGTGTTLEAAQLLGRHGIGIELNADHCRSAERRIAQGTLGLSA